MFTQELCTYQRCDNVICKSIKGIITRNVPVAFPFQYVLYAPCVT